MAPPSAGPLSDRILLAAFAGLALLIGGLWYADVRTHEATVLHDRGHELQAIADLKIEFIRYWLAERRSDAEIPASAPLIVRAAEFGPRRSGPGNAEAIRGRIEAIRSGHDYNAVMLLDRGGQVRAEAGLWSENARRRALGTAQASITAGKTVFSPAYESAAGGQRHFDIDLATPVFAAGSSAPRIVGALVTHFNPRTHLDPVLRLWPSPSESGETVLVERAGDRINFLSTLRHAEAASWQWNADDPQLPAAMAARGQRGVVAGVDYRGVPVLAAIGQVPGVPWSLVAKLDRAEILDPLRREALNSGVLAALLLLLLGFAMLAWRKRRNTELALLNEVASRKALAASEARFRKLNERGWDFTVLFDRDMTVRYASTAVDRYLGRPALGEPIASGTALVHPDDVAQIEAARQAALNLPGVPQPFTHRLSRRNGGWWTAEASFTNYFDDPDIGALAYVAHDISARVATEAALKESEERYRIFFQLSPDAVFVHRNNVIFMANEAAARFFRADSAEALVGRDWHELLTAEQWPRIDARVALLASGTAAFLPPAELTYCALDGATIHAEATAARILVGGMPAILSVTRDITERREAEATRLAHARQQRDALVREVHHRIKNHLQGLAGLLRRNAAQDAALKPALEEVIAQINAISIVHGLQGRTEHGHVSLRGLVSEIATFLGNIRGVPLGLEDGTGQRYTPQTCPSNETCIWSLPEEESVPLALIVNELLTNAVRHRAGAAPLSIALECDNAGARLTIRNPGHLAGLNFDQGKGLGTGLGLVRSLMPPAGLTIGHGETADGMVETRLVLDASILQRAPQAGE